MIILIGVGALVALVLGLAWLSTLNRAAQGMRSTADHLRANRPELEQQISETLAPGPHVAATVAGINRATAWLQALGSRKL